MPNANKPLDIVVKLGLGVFFGAFALIWAGMFLTRPDRSIPPYSIGAQEGTLVAVHVPVYTSDTEIEALIRRFQKVAREKDFGRMKIKPTTPDDPAGRYERITIYVFTHDAWAEPEMLHRYVEANGSPARDEQSVREAFEKAVRGFYRLENGVEEGRIGPIDQMMSGKESPATAAYSRRLFTGPVQASSSPPASPSAPAP
ncbi:hypothetical protein [Candidatus Nitrospira bockiana]